MKITRIEKFSEKELIEKLKNVTMLKAPQTKVYTNTLISLEKLRPEFLAPPQNYILKQELKKVRELKWTLEKHDINIFELKGFLRISFDSVEEPVDLLPPIIEESIESDGSLHLIINDGMHRVYMALREWVIPEVALIRGIPKNLPYYAFPVPGGWNSVEEREDLPPDYLKKWHRISDYHSLYRNFNSAFKNVGGPREFFQKS
ncbi:MAG: hypothetical protein M1511_01705 [Deltaproteobacteria bacterium]|nr:hypothetical protein [Deltaproteobacteria bacterium]